MTFLYGLILLDGTIKSVCLTGSPRLPNNFPTNLLFNGRHETITFFFFFIFFLFMVNCGLYKMAKTWLGHGLTFFFLKSKILST